ncbi:dioxygenase [Gallaecimonas pentaromativorans]|uniref:dioxygenase family protein n=1 Tax=Gallaecimonas pentaromativorans TaxID=584787 RepID=UPI003A933D40
MAPALFVSHGAPSFALEPGLAGPALQALGANLKPKAVVIVSPHWMTRGGVAVTTGTHLETIHDFGGFAPALYQLAYPAKGDPALASEVMALLEKAGWPVVADPHRGLDHGAWVPLMHLYPKADVPVVAVSMPYPMDATAALALGKALAPLRAQNVLVLGSGSLTHNLYEFRQHSLEDEAYVARFAAWVRAKLATGDDAALVDLYNQSPDARRAHPTNDHYLPLLVALGARRQGDAFGVLEGGITHGVLAMDSFLFGEAQ